MPRWRERELFYVSGGNLMSVEVETAPTLRASAPRVLFAIPPLSSFGGPGYDVSPDGTQVAFVSSRTGDPELYVMKADGTDVRRLTFFHKEDMERLHGENFERFRQVCQQQDPARKFANTFTRRLFWD